jgi:hypothetical protein
MNSLRLSIAILTFAAANVYAGEPTTLHSVTARDDTRLVVDCRAERLPSQRAVAEVLDTNNASRIHAERERLVHTAHRQCMRGVASVTFVRDTSESISTLALVDAGR